MATPTCAICNSAAAKRCSSCLSISYCSPSCQKEDWPLHKTICKNLTTLPQRPSPSHKLAILLPVDLKDPQLTWAHFERNIDEEDGVSYEMADLSSFLEKENLDPKYHDAREHKPVTRNVLRGFNLDHTVQVVCRETFLIDGSTSNACVRQTTRGKMTHDWRGPIVVMRQPGTATDPLVYEDMTAADLRVAVDYFVAYGRKL